MKRIVVIAVVAIILGGNCWAEEPKWQEISRGEVNVKSAVVDPDDPKVIYMGTDKGIFKTIDAGGTWRNILLLRGDNRLVNQLVFDPQDKKVLYAATGVGLYYSANEGLRWTRIFKGKSSYENDCSSSAVLPRGIYLGTKSGLFFSEDKGRTWHKEAGRLKDSRIFNIAYLSKEQGYVYVSCVDGVFRKADNALDWERVYVTHPGENGGEAQEENEDRDDEELHSEIRYLAIEPGNVNNIYLATSRGIYKSKNGVSEWELLTEYGLLSRDTRFLIFSSRLELYAATKSGVFVFKNDTWRELSFNLSASNINYLALDKEGNLYACADKGLFKVVMGSSAALVSPDIISEYFKLEPGIEEVQKQAVRYAEVSPEKIINWRKQAQKKAILPQLSIGFDRNSGDLWHWESGSSSRDCDDNLRRGRDTLDWDVRLSWDLSELIWNNDQTSIDTRSRLMVQLRDDILDEVNKTYFERIRVKMEMDSLQIEDRKKRFEKELRIRELTASLDALTGGFFSNQIRANKVKYIHQPLAGPGEDTSRRNA
jgi:hypothetical protein